MNKLLEKSIASRNELAIKKLVNRESEKEWAKNNTFYTLEERAKYLEQQGRDFIKGNKITI
jgi:hypothetical protein